MTEPLETEDKLRAEIASLKALLKEVQYCADTSSNPRSGRCPVCFEYYKHKPNCRLAVALGYQQDQK